jgi:cytochrome c553
MMPTLPRSVTMRVVARTVVLSVTILLWVVLVSCGGPAPPPLKLHADVKQIMAAVVDPSADVVWDSVGTIVTVEGTEEIRPRDSEEWTQVAQAAWVLTESANSLMIGNRPKDTSDWMRFAQEMADASVKAARAAESHDADALFTAGGDIYLACTACHEKYNINLTAAVK